jgi:hypothetical protein
MSRVHKAYNENAVTQLPQQPWNSKWRDKIIDYTPWLIIPPNMKAIGSKTSEELRTQNETGQTANEWANEQTDKPNNYNYKWLKFVKI